MYQFSLRVVGCTRLFLKNLISDNSRICVPHKYLLIIKANYCTKQIPVPFTMKLTSAAFQSLITEDVKYLQDLFEKNGHKIRIAGGAVRDLLSGSVPKDLDFATTATPTKMKEMFTENGIRLINARGECHGTITPRINENNFEITTLRIDQVTDGRHALVKFTEDWYLDASRRDLTINAMFLDFDGTLLDYFNGYEDLKNHRVVFVGEASKRIQEDYLRILRYFRFYGRIAKEPDNHNEETLAAIKENASGLRIISGERIQMELSKIISGNFGVELLKKILSLGIGQYIGLPEYCNTQELDKVSERIKKNNWIVDPMTLLSCLFSTPMEVDKFIERIKPSGFQRKLAYFIVDERNKGIEKYIGYYQKLVTFSNNKSVMKQHVEEYLKYMGETDMLNQFQAWTVPTFPLTGVEIEGKGIPDKTKVGFIKNKLHEIWIDSNYTLSKEDLINCIMEVAATYEPRRDSKKNMHDKKKKERKENILLP